MSLPRLLSIALLASAVAAAPASAVSGGASTDISAAPYVVYLGNCTGTLIAPDRVLTAAHCASVIDPDTTHAVIGTNDVGGNKGFVNGVLTPVVPPASALYPIKGFVGHPGFRLEFPFAKGKPQYATADDDVAFVVLARPVTGIAPVPIATPADAAALEAPGSAVTLLGYGNTMAKPGFGPTVLQSGELSLITAASCQSAYPNAVHPDRELCAQDLAGGPLVQPCAGDSGGPLIAHGPEGPVQIGVTSWGSEVRAKKCGEAHLPAVWMRVSHYASFLTDPTPVFEPHTQARPTVRGTHTLTCTAPAFKGSRAKLSYEWGIARFRLPSREQPNPIRPLKGATSRRFTPTTATRGKRIACAVTARNGSGSWTAYSKSIKE